MRGSDSLAGNDFGVGQSVTSLRMKMMADDSRGEREVGGMDEVHTDEATRIVSIPAHYLQVRRML